jgi:hypothetical protein
MIEQARMLERNGAPSQRRQADRNPRGGYRHAWRERADREDCQGASDSLPTISFPHALHRKSFVPISRGILGHFFSAGRVYASWPYSCI